MKTTIPVALVSLVILITIITGNTCVYAQETINLTEEASNALSRAEEISEDIRDVGFGTSFFEDALLDAREAFRSRNYELVLDRVEQISRRSERAELQKYI
ncbi:MAG: hypothetical protein V3U72_00960 [Candidatus Aenigmarchaeota archaeon]